VPLLEIKNLKLDFVSESGRLRAVDDVTLSVGEGETVCLVGESGCGKSVTALSIARLIPTPPAAYAGGEILLQGQNVLASGPKELCAIRGGVVSYVFQEPAASLNPVIRVGAQILEMLKLHRRPKANRTEIVRLLKVVGITDPESRMNDYPFQMSGGMQQRIMIAMALACEPRLLVADEPTTALDVTIQAQILSLLAELQRRLGMAILLITHNFAVVSQVAHRVAVMYAGEIVELAPARELISAPAHPYTRALINAIPDLHGDSKTLSAIPGNVPSPGQFPSGCRFFPRCPSARPECAGTHPPLRQLSKARWVRCLYAGSDTVGAG
jgi:oligopeptide/dipeptide ABC transporter ATP-binding protein